MGKLLSKTHWLLHALRHLHFMIITNINGVYFLIALQWATLGWLLISLMDGWNELFRLEQALKAKQLSFSAVDISCLKLDVFWVGQVATVQDLKACGWLNARCFLFRNASSFNHLTPCFTWCKMVPVPLCTMLFCVKANVRSSRQQQAQRLAFIFMRDVLLKHKATVSHFSKML